MVDVFVILPDQLFYTEEALSIVLNDNTTHVYMFEDPLYFTARRYHASKLAMHRASMNTYFKLLKKAANVIYVPHTEITTDFIDYLKLKVSPTSVEMFYPNSMDEWGYKLFDTEFNGLRIKFHDSPAFLLTYNWVRAQGGTATSRTTFNQFYKKVRKEFFPQLNPRNSNGVYTPIGGKWTWGDDYNVGLPSTVKIAALPKLSSNSEWKNAIVYVGAIPHVGKFERHPIDGKEALVRLKSFLAYKLADYGGRQNTAVVGNGDSSLDDVTKTLFHSVISSSLNIGILTPKQVATELLIAFRDRHHEIPVNSFETFFRQLIWREYMRMMYINMPSQMRKIPNVFNAKNTISNAYYTGTTNMQPIDHCIKSVLATGYAHHTIRAYWLCGWMIMCRIKPIDIYEWFLTMFVDAYPWVALTNVICAHGSPQFHNSIVIKSSTWITNTSNLKRTKNISWHGNWDLIYYLFIHTNVSKLNRIDAKLSKQWTSKPTTEKRKILESARALAVEYGIISLQKQAKPATPATPTPATPATPTPATPATPTPATPATPTPVTSTTLVRRRRNTVAKISSNEISDTTAKK